MSFHILMDLQMKKRLLKRNREFFSKLINFDENYRLPLTIVSICFL